MMYQGDNTEAFGGTFLSVNLTNDTGYAVSKAVWKCGKLRKEFANPTFPLIINLDSKETKELYENNTCYLAVWDSEGRKKTCEGSLNFQTKAEVVNGECSC